MLFLPTSWGDLFNPLMRMSPHPPPTFQGSNLLWNFLYTITSDRIITFVQLLLCLLFYGSIYLTLRFYFNFRIKSCNLRIERTEKKKSSLLQRLLDDTQFVKTREILARYGKIENNTNAPTTPGQQIKQQKHHPNSTKRHTRTTSIPPSSSNNSSNTYSNSGANPYNRRAVSPPPPPSAIDRVINLLTGSDPSNKYALICSVCHAHCGLLPPSRFSTTPFYCPYCLTFNGPVEKIPNLDAIFQDKQERLQQFASSASSTSNTQQQYEVNVNPPSSLETPRAKHPGRSDNSLPIPATVSGKIGRHNSISNDPIFDKKMTPPPKL